MDKAGHGAGGNSHTHLFSPHASGSKSQNCLWNSLIDGLTGNVKEKPRPTIVHDPRPPEEILADELPQLDSPEALVKTSFRFGGLQLFVPSSLLVELFQSSWMHHQCGQSATSFLCTELIRIDEVVLELMFAGLLAGFPECSEDPLSS